MLGNEEDFTAALGFEVEGLDENLSALDPANFRKMIEHAIAAFPNFQAVATTLRNAKTASINDWAAVLYTDGTLYSSRAYHDLEIWDRVGGGDSFASGLVYGFLAGKGPQWAVECGAAHGAPRDDDAGRHDDGLARRGRARHEGRLGARRSGSVGGRKSGGQADRSSSASPRPACIPVDPRRSADEALAAVAAIQRGRPLDPRDHDDRPGRRDADRGGLTRLPRTRSWARERCSTR